MFHLSLLSQIYPIIIQQPQLFALSLTSNQLPYCPPRRARSRKKSKPANKAITNGKQSEAQRTALKAGLQKSLDASNKGFEILKKMGYEEGKPLGKDGSGIIEPISITIKNNPNNRAGLGQEATKTVTIKKDPIKAESKVKEEKSKISAATIKKVNLTKRERRLQNLEAEYREDIELLRLRLQAELSVKSTQSDSMVIAHVAITGEPICKEIFKIIHQYLVNSLHVYTGNPFPMFHDIAHVDDEIKVICEDTQSFDYLSNCITALSANLSIPMTTTRFSPIGSNVYWFAAQIQGLVNGPQSFLSQIKKHRLNLKPDRWIIVTQQPCPKANKTNLQIITDEHSAMLLIYRYSLKLFVCMQEMEFTLRGKIPFSN